MCQTNYTRARKKYQHLIYSERTMIERWYNKENKSIKVIADNLDKSERTIRREIKRGLTRNLDSEWREISVYSADIAQGKYDYNIKAKGPDIKISSDYDLAIYIEQEIKLNLKSPEAIVADIKNHNLTFVTSITARTIRNYIKSGDVFDLSTRDLTYNKKQVKSKKAGRVSSKVPAEKSIDHRPEEANERTAYGHWEGDCVVGKREGRGPVLLTLTERMTREIIILKLKYQTGEEVKKAFNRLERKLGKRFKSKFKTITFDNGSEFLDYKGIEGSCLSQTTRTNVYYAHPYSSWQRGSNENNNRMIRRWIPKGTDIGAIKLSYIKHIEKWINDYPREIFGYKSTNMILVKI